MAPAGDSSEGEPWREWMPAVREVAGELASEGVIRVTQGGKTVSVASARGPIRLALVETDGTAEGGKDR